MSMWLAVVMVVAADSADVLPRIAALTPEQTEVVCMMAAGRSPTDFYVALKSGDPAARETIIGRLPEVGRPLVRAGLDTVGAVSPERLAAARVVLESLCDPAILFPNVLELLSMRGRHREAAESLEVGFRQRSDFRDAGYYLWAAHEWAMAGDKSAALRNLELAVADSLSDMEQLRSDTAFRSLQNDRRWNALVAKVQAAAGRISATLPDSHVPLKVVSLPAPGQVGRMTVEQALAERRSIREYAAESLTLEQVAQLLWAAYGVTRPIPNAPRLRGGLKTAPSAGGRYPLELYLVAGNVTGLEPGVYNYRPEKHELWQTVAGDRRPQVDNGQGMVEAAPATIVYSAVFERNTGKYGQRGRERYVCMDLGHSAENVYLQATALGLGTCAVGAFVDMDLKVACRMTRDEEPLYIMPVGRPAQ